MGIQILRKCVRRSNLENLGCCEKNELCNIVRPRWCCFLRGCVRHKSSAERICRPDDENLGYYSWKTCFDSQGASGSGACSCSSWRQMCSDWFCRSHCESLGYCQWS